MTTMQEALRQKIDTEEKWQELCRQFATVYPVNVGSYAIENESSDEPWWAHREAARLQHGVYDTSQCLQEINSLRPGMFVHVSTDDPTMIAYTLDAEAGKADRQLKTSLGKFLRKHFVLFPDHAIESLTNKHKADLSCEVEFISGMEIVDVYKSNSLTSCMTKDFAHRDYGALQHHPTEVYDAPNIRMAVMRGADGRVTARCMVYEPAENDKRYIRGYGERTLIRRLERLGYVPGCYMGAKFKKLPLPKLGKTFYAMPYLDSFGGSGTTRAGAIVLLDDEITVIDYERAQRIQGALNRSMGNTTNTSGYVRLDNVSTSELMFKDPIHGKDIDVTAVETALRYYFTKEGQIVSSYASTDDYAIYRGTSDYGNITRRYGIVSVDEGHRTVYCLKSDPKFVHRYDEYIDTPAARERLGYLKLSPKYYPELYVDGKSPDYLVKGTYYIVEEAGVNHPVLMTDCVKVLTHMTPEDMAGPLVVQSYVHKSIFNKKQHVKVHRTPTKDVDTWAQPAMIVQTKSGRKVVPGYHEVQKDCLTDLWEFTRNMQSTHIGYESYFTHKDTPDWRNRLRQYAVGKFFDKWVEAGARASELGTVLTNLGLDTYGQVDGTRMSLDRLISREYTYVAILTAISRYGKYRNRTSQELGKRLDYLVAEVTAFDYNAPTPERVVNAAPTMQETLDTMLGAAEVTIGDLSPRCQGYAAPTSTTHVTILSGSGTTATVY